MWCSFGANVHGKCVVFICNASCNADIVEVEEKKNSEHLSTQFLVR